MDKEKNFLEDILSGNGNYRLCNFGGVISNEKKSVGHITPFGDIYAYKGYGGIKDNLYTPLGKIDSKGIIWNEDRKVIGYIDSDGKIWNEEGIIDNSGMNKLGNKIREQFITSR